MAKRAPDAMSRNPTSATAFAFILSWLCHVPAWAYRAIASVVAGVVITCAVALYCANSIEIGAHPVGTVVFGEPFMFASIWRTKGGERVFSSYLHSGPGNASRAAATRTLIGTEQIASYPQWARAGNGALPGIAVDCFRDFVVEDAYGWPWLAMRCIYKIHCQPCALPRGLQVKPRNRIVIGVIPEELQSAEWRTTIPLGGIQLPPGKGKSNREVTDVRALPVIPIWKGFAANTLMVGFPLFGLLSVPSAFRSLRRLKWRFANRCQNCGYVLLESQRTCSECGQPRHVRG